MSKHAQKSTRSSRKKENKQDLFLLEFLKKIRAGNPLHFTTGLLRSGMISYRSRKSYRRSNLYALWIAKIEREALGLSTSPFWATFPAIKAAGGHVNKGSRGVHIWIPMTGKKTVLNKKTGEEEEKEYRYFSTRPVFNLADTTGMKLPEDLQPREVEINQEIESYLFVKITRNSRGAFAYTPALDQITMPPQCDVDTDENYYQSLLHELCHATGVKQRLNRSFMENYHTCKASRAKEEFVAEFGSYLLGKEFGIISDKQEKRTLSYLAGWGKHIDDQEALDALKGSFEAIESILSRQWFQKEKIALEGFSSTLIAKEL